MRLTLAIANLKPGTSKTTTAVFLALALQRQGRVPVLIDADPGQSARVWADMAIESGEPLPFDVQSMPTRTIGHQLRSLQAHADYDAIVIDLPQLEDHADIGRPALRFARHWLVPLAPAGIELDRTAQVRSVLDGIDADREDVGDPPGVRWALLTRTNRRQRSRRGPDATIARLVAEQGYQVFDEQVHHSDDRFRQTFGVVPDLDGTPFPEIAEKLVAA